MKDSSALGGYVGLLLVVAGVTLLLVGQYVSR